MQPWNMNGTRSANRIATHYNECEKRISRLLFIERIAGHELILDFKKQHTYFWRTSEPSVLLNGLKLEFAHLAFDCNAIAAVYDTFFLLHFQELANRIQNVGAKYELCAVCIWTASISPLDLQCTYQNQILLLLPVPVCRHNVERAKNLVSPLILLREGNCDCCIDYKSCSPLYSALFLPVSLLLSPLRTRSRPNSWHAHTHTHSLRWFFDSSVLNLHVTEMWRQIPDCGRKKMYCDSGSVSIRRVAYLLTRAPSSSHVAAQLNRCAKNLGLQTSM